ncbi:hypothetical protein AX16_001664, partial [Volvariella volvacea WC 439]
MNMPCQRKDWWVEEVRQSLRMKGGPHHSLPHELLDLIIDGMEDFPIGIDEANDIRLQLTDERKDLSLQLGYAFTAIQTSIKGN